MMKKLVLLLVTVLLLSATLPLATAESQTVDRINLALSTEEGALNPYGYSSETGYNLTHLIYDSLFILDTSRKPIPWLVEEYTFDEDELTYTFKIHDEVYFQDGEKLTAEDVKFTFDYLKEYPKSRFSQPSQVITNIEVIDELTLTMTLGEQFPDFLDKPLSEMGILPKHIWSKVDNPDAFTDTTGSGMYEVTEVAERQYYILEKNKNYWKGEVAVDMLYLPYITDASTRQTALLTGELDATAGQLNAEVIEQFVNAGKFNIYQGAGFPSTMLYFNCDRHPFDNPQFRQALSLAIDRQDIIDTVMLGYATSGTNSLVHPTMPYFNKNVVEPKFNIEEANSILDDLGFMDRDNDGIREMDGKPLDFTILVYASSTPRTRTAELIKDWYKQIGVGITISAMDMDTVDNIVWPGYMSAHDLDFDMVMWGWGASTMSANYVDRLWNSDLEKGTSNIGAFASNEVDKLTEQIMKEVDNDKRFALLEHLQGQLVSEYPVYVFYYADLVYATSKKYDGWSFQDGAGILNVFSFLREKEPEQARVETSEEQSDNQPDSKTESSAGETTSQDNENNDHHQGENLTTFLLPILLGAVIVGFIFIKNRKK